MLPILHLNGYKIANPTMLARITPEELDALIRGYGYTPYVVEGDDPHSMHQKMAETLERVITEIRAIQAEARSSGQAERSALADDRAANSEGMDRSEGGGRSQSGGLLARPSSPDSERGRESRAPDDCRAMAAQLQAGRAIRRKRRARAELHALPRKARAE